MANAQIIEAVEDSFRRQANSFQRQSNQQNLINHGQASSYQQNYPNSLQRQPSQYGQASSCQQNYLNDGQEIILVDRDYYYPHRLDQIYPYQGPHIYPHQSKYPVSAKCKSCKLSIQTKTKQEFGNTSFLYFLILLVLFFPLFFIPFVYDDCKDTRHYCPNCNESLGTFHAEFL